MTQEGAVSADNLERLRVCNEVWEGMLGIVGTQGNAVDPFAPVLRTSVWREIWDEIAKVLADTELIPLP